MKIEGKNYRTIWFENNEVKIIDQTKLPHQFVIKSLKTVKEAIENVVNQTRKVDNHPPLRVLRGGSFLCNDSYCSGYRNAMRMKTSPDTSSIHAGFRTVIDGI